MRPLDPGIFREFFYNAIYIPANRCKKTSDITVDGETVQCLENFEYIGSKIEGNGKCSNEIKRRTAMAAGQLKKMEKNLERTR